MRQRSRARWNATKPTASPGIIKPSAPNKSHIDMGIFASLSRNSALLGLHVSEVGLLIAGIILAIGVIGEMKTPTGFPILWPRLWAFELLVLIGVMGELICDGGVFIFSERLQEISDSELQVVIKDVGNTHVAAGKAADAAARANAS